MTTVNENNPQGSEPPSPAPEGEEVPQQRRSIKDSLKDVGTGALTGIKKGYEKVKENQTVQKGAAAVKTAYESEKVQKGIGFVKDKANAIKENEKVQKGTEFVKDKAVLLKDKTVAGAGFVKEKSKSAWTNGKGKIERVKTIVREGEWKGSAANTLGVEVKEGLWKDIKVKGAEEMIIEARKEHTSAYHIEKGQLIRWTFRVKERDLGFGVRMRVMADGGATEEEVLPVEKFDDQETISGSYFCQEKQILVLVFDNSYSKLRSKTVAYMVGVETPKDDIELDDDEIEVEPDSEEDILEPCL